MLSLDGLQKHVDPSQLVTDLNGKMQFDHLNWLTSRMMLEEFTDNAVGLLKEFDELMGSLRRSDVGGNISSAKTMLQYHSQLRENIQTSAVESLTQDAQAILKRLDQSRSINAASSSGDSEYSQATKHITTLLNRMHISRTNVQETWHQRKVQLDQCLQLQLFQRDVEQMLRWIAHEKEKFLMTYTDIGTSFHQAHELQSQHIEFATTCESVQVQVSEIKSTAHRLADAGHYAAANVKMQAQKLDLEWKAFYTAIEDRTNVINRSTSFHEKIEQYMLDVPNWLSEVKNQGVPDAIDELEEAVARFDDLHAAFHTFYNQVVSEGNGLLEILQTPVASSAYNSIISQADYRVGASHLINMIHETLEKNKTIEDCWVATKAQLNQKLGLRLFQKDVLQVLTWLDEHGNVFLDKNINVGRSLQKASSLQKAHEHFETIAENTITNAEKLLHAADELAQSGECNAEQINMEAGKLESKIREFLQRLEQRKNLLNLTVSFYTHTQELSEWFEELRAELLDGKLAEDVGEATLLVNQFHRQKEATTEAAVNTINEGESLLEQLGQVKMGSESATEDFAHIHDILENLNEARETLGELWNKRKIKLDLSLELQCLEEDASKVSICEWVYPFEYTLLI
ncbi:trio [Bugula neritina]|uniref:Trio n=1 Tax=Bugula neritina TaxID=10212 RepID=A0A7J7J6X2_BUGNE|nr:trio [Bugula neritina]